MKTWIAGEKLFASDLNSNFVETLFDCGDGFDGAFVVSGTTTLTRDYYYTDLTINSGCFLITNGYRVFVKGTLLNNGTIKHNGSNGTNGGAGGNAVNGSTGAGGTAGTGGAVTLAGMFPGSPSGQNGGLGKLAAVTVTPLLVGHLQL